MPFSIFKIACLPIVYLRFGVILRAVSFCPLIVLKCVLDHGEADDKDKRWHHSWLSIRYRNLVYHLHEHDYQEVKIWELKRELLKQVTRQKVPPSILRSAHRVVLNVIPSVQTLQIFGCQVYITDLSLDLLSISFRLVGGIFALSFLSLWAALLNIFLLKLFRLWLRTFHFFIFILVIINKGIAALLNTLIYDLIHKKDQNKL